MPKSENQKQKILFVMDYLQKHSHKDNPINTTELIRMLKQENISADRKSIYSDIQALIEFGLDIVSLPGKKGGYYIAAPKDFQMSELKLLIDAVLSSRYLTEKKSRELIKKLCDLCGTDKEAELVSRKNYGEQRNGCSSEKERKVNALALRADEGRDYLR